MIKALFRSVATLLGAAVAATLLLAVAIIAAAIVIGGGVLIALLGPPSVAKTFSRISGGRR